MVPEMPRLFLTSDLDRCGVGEGWGCRSSCPRRTPYPCLGVFSQSRQGAERRHTGPSAPDPTPACASSLSFPVTPQGCSVTLACGVRLQFPAGATAASVTIRYRLWLPEPRLVPLGPHDSLLSGVLELQPHGVAFQQARPGRVGGQVRRAQARTPCSRHPCLAGGGPVAAVCAPTALALP